MKKILLSIVFLVGALSSVHSLEPNPYAYNLYTTDYDEANYKITLHFSTSALAKAIKIYAIDQLGNEYLMRQYGETRPDGYQTIINLFDLMAAGAPPGEELSWRVDCYGENITKPTTCGKRIDFNNPYSIDVDRNPNSPYFGTILITQASNASSSYKRGIKKFNPKFVQEGDVSYIDPDVKLAPVGDSWFYNTHVTPFRVRMLQDGTGRVFVSSADYQQPTYMWTTNLANLNDWTSLFASSEIVTLTNHPAKENTMANCNFDLRKNANGQLEMLLLSGSLDANTDECAIGYPYSGVYTFNMTPTTLEKVGYTVLSESPDGNPHSFIKNIFVGSVLTGNAMFDPNGGVWYSSYSSSAEIDKSSLIHRNTQGEFVQDYVDGNYLKRWATAGGGMRYNSDFTQMVVAQGATSLSDEIRIYNVDHSTSHPTLSGGVGVSLVSGTRSNTMHILDMAWDYASNIYVCSRNANDADLRGIWVVATPLGGKPVTTTAREQYKFSIPCEPGNQYTVSVECNPVEAGSITCTSPNGARVAGVVTVESCTPITLTAVPDANFQFVNWTDESGKEVSTSAEYTFYVVKNTNLTANFKYANYTGVTWWNLFKKGQDIADRTPGYHENVNERLWRLFQVSYNSAVGYKDDQGVIPSSTTKSYNHLLTTTFIYRDPSKSVSFFQDSKLFSWMMTYMEAHGIPKTKSKNVWNYAPHLLFNRTDSTYNSPKPGTYGLVNCMASGAYDATSSWSNAVTWDSFITYGKPEHWRPYWTEGVCNLPRSMKYSDEMPIFSTWATNRPNCPSGSIAGVTPSEWFQWNDPPADTKINKHILAWRNEAGNIVHHVYEDNLKLFVSYVKKNIEENDTIDASINEASNDDVIRLMQNRRYVNLDPNPAVQPTHDLTVTRRLQAGMYNTICLPFGVDLSGLMDDHPLKYKANGTGAKVLEFIGVTQTQNEAGEDVTILNFQQVTSTQAGKPYLVQLRDGATDLTEDMLFTTVSSFPDLHPVAHNGVTFQPTINATSVPEGSLILVANDRLAQTTEPGEMLGLRGYFTIDPMIASDIAAQAADGRVYLSMKKPVTTSIPVAPEAEQQTKPQVSKVMYDGNIYILRGEEVYTLTGHRVK
jgi:hypothetical protein